MAYCTQADLTETLSQQKLSELTDDEKLGIINTSRVALAIATADAEINGFLAGRYTVPIAPVPPLVKSWSVLLTVYYLWRRRQHVPADVRLAYEDVIARLRDAAQGSITLGLAEAPPTVSGTEGSVSGPARVFTRTLLGDF